MHILGWRVGAVEASSSRHLRPRSKRQILLKAAWQRQSAPFNIRVTTLTHGVSLRRLAGNLY